MVSECFICFVQCFSSFSILTVFVGEATHTTNKVWLMWHQHRAGWWFARWRKRTSTRPARVIDRWPSEARFGWWMWWMMDFPEGNASSELLQLPSGDLTVHYWTWLMYSWCSHSKRGVSIVFCMFTSGYFQLMGLMGKYGLINWWVNCGDIIDILGISGTTEGIFPSDLSSSGTAVLFFCIVELTNIDPMYQHQGCQELGLLVGVPVTCSFVHLLDSGDYMGRQKRRIPYIWERSPPLQRIGIWATGWTVPDTIRWW